MSTISLGIRLLAGRYHATPWDRHVNEGSVEWPPSPWRVLRALAAGAWRVWPDGPPPTLTDAIDRLGRALPVYLLPPVNFAHTRHYMPITEGTKEKTTLVFDAFAATDKGAEIVVSWREVELDAEMRHALASAAEAVTYLGRTESWAECEILEEEDLAEPHAWPAADDEEEEADTVTLLASEPVESCWTALQAVTSELHAKRWSRAPGTRWVSYALDPPTSQRRRVQLRRHGAAAMLFAAWSRAPIKVEDTVVLAESVRGSVLSARKVWDVDDRRLHGHAEDGSPLEGHEHAFFLPYDEDGDTEIDHVLLYFRHEVSAEIAEAVERAVSGWRDLTPWKRRSDEAQDFERDKGQTAARCIRLTLIQTWTEEELEREEDHRKPRPLRSSRVWESRTPFVLTRHPKRHRDGRPKLDEAGQWRDGPWDQCRRGLRDLGIETSIADVVLRDAAQGVRGGRRVPWVRFRRKRRFGHGARFGSRGHGFRIVFEEPVSGPIAVGYGSHFGLGLFLPESPLRGLEELERSASDLRVAATGSVAALPKRARK